MTAEVLKYTWTGRSAGTGSRHGTRESGRLGSRAGHEDDLREALEKALDYRGDMTLTLKTAKTSRPSSSIAKPAPRWPSPGCSTYTPTAPEKRK